MSGVGMSGACPGETHNNYNIRPSGDKGAVR